MTTTPVKEHLFHVLSSGLHGMLLAGSTDFIYFFLDFFNFFYKEPVLNVPEQTHFFDYLGKTFGKREWSFGEF